MASDVRGRRGRQGALAAVAAVLVVAAVSVAALDLTGRLPGGLVGNEAPVTVLSTLPGSPAVTDPVRPPTPAPVLGDASVTAGIPLPAVGALTKALAGPALGGNPGAVVLDVATGQSLLDQDGSTPRTPASVAKLATAAAALMTLPANQRLVTRVVGGSPVAQPATPSPGVTASTGSSVAREVVLVGAGDARLTRADVGRLAAATARSLSATDPAAGSASATASVSVGVDDSLFSGPALEPGWPATYVPAGVVSPVSALSVDGGRLRPGSEARSPDPALAAGELLAAGLRRRGITVAEVVDRAAAPAGAAVLAQVESPTVPELVEQALQNSDNDLAEALLRLVGIGAGQPGSFEGGASAVAAALVALGVPTDGLDLRDGSGLDRASQVAPVTVARILLAAADGSHPELAPVLDGLPVAGFSGTLALRFRDPAGTGSAGGASAAGLVRGKTGTLTGVSALAGTTSASGRPVVFAVMSKDVPVRSTLQARADLDRFAELLTNPGD